MKVSVEKNMNIMLETSEMESEPDIKRTGSNSDVIISLNVNDFTTDDE